MSQHTTQIRNEETTLFFTNIFGEDLRIPYTPEDYAWRAKAEGYSNVRVESRIILMEVTTTDWKPVDEGDCDGCCTSCAGTGSSSDVETNGRCWDCYGTGHTHK